jgi:hypothetical protein
VAINIGNFVMRHRYCSLTVLALMLQTIVQGNTRASEVCDHWLPGPLHNQPQGINSQGVINASAIWSPATGGTFLVVAGTISTAGGVPVNGLAAWDGASWRDLGGGVDFSPQALAVYNGDLIVGGNFDFAGGVPAVNIARYDGTTWHALGQGLTGAEPPGVAFCTALAVFNGDLIAGGHFQTAGGVTATNIARWNGTSWSAMGSGVGQPSDIIGGVNVLRVHTNNVLYIGGFFSTAGGVGAFNIVQFNGASYAEMSLGTGGNNPSVHALHSFGNDLVVGGDFITVGVGNLFVNHVARWTPGAGTSGTWGTMGASGLGLNLDSVQAFQPFNGQLVAGGTFPGAVSAWNGSTWVNLGTNLAGGTPPQDPRCFTLNVFNGNLVAAGNFTTAGGVPTTNIAQWSGSFWSALQAPAPQVLAFETLGSRFVAAGSFLQSTTSQTPAHNIIGWNGSTLTRVQNSICCGEGTNGTIRALRSSTGFNNELFVAGDFTVAGGVAANRIAKYTEPGLLPASWSAMGSGFNGSVLALEWLPANQFFGETIFAGGEFTAAGNGSPAFNRIASWSGSPPQWFTLGTGFNNRVRALKGFNSGPVARFLYAGGDFTTASGLSANRIAHYPIPNQNGWVAMGSGFNAPVHAIERHNGSIYAAGEFTASGATPISHVARWTGTTWESVDGGTNGVVTALKSDGTNIYAIGGFTLAGGVAVNRVARWNSTEGWSDVEGGTNDVVNTLGFYHGEVQVGLGISLGLNGPENPAPQPGKGWVRYSPTGIPWIANNPLSQTISCFGNATFTSQPAQGYSLLLASWFKNGVPLNDGPTGHGSTISGAHASTLTITGARTFDAGSYTCSFANICGAATSSAATLIVNNCCDPDISPPGGDEVVNVSDLLAVINQWGPCPAPPASCLADIAPTGGNGVINVSDLLAVINGWGACP